MAFDQLPTDEVIQKTIAALKQSGIEAMVVGTGQEAKQKVLEMLPAGAEIMTMSSTTLDTISLAQEINESGKYNSVRKKLMSMDKATQGQDMNKLGAAPEWTVGSVHAVTQDGKVVIASNSGSQLPAYAYGAGYVIWVVGGQKLVASLDEALKRVYEYCLPLESQRANKAYNITTGSNVSKLLVINKEIKPGRITMLIVKEVLGF